MDTAEIEKLRIKYRNQVYIRVALSPIAFIVGIFLIAEFGHRHIHSFIPGNPTIAFYALVIFAILTPCYAFFGKAFPVGKYNYEIFSLSINKILNEIVSDKNTQLKSLKKDDNRVRLSIFHLTINADNVYSGVTANDTEFKIIETFGYYKETPFMERGLLYNEGFDILGCSVIQIKLKKSYNNEFLLRKRVFYSDGYWYKKIAEDLTKFNLDNVFHNDFEFFADNCNVLNITTPEFVNLINSLDFDYSFFVYNNYFYIINPARMFNIEPYNIFKPIQEQNENADIFKNSINKTISIVNKVEEIGL